MIRQGLVAAASFWLATQAGAVDPFAIAVRVRDDGPVRTLALAGRQPVRLRAVRYEPRPGLSQSAAQFRCGIILETPGGVPARIETIGSGETEALSCDGLAEAGAATKRGPIIVLVYRTRSPNEESRTPVLVRWEQKAGSWIIDEAQSARMSTSLRTVSLATIRRALAR